MIVKKQLSANDLGHTGAHQAGILVPKTGRVLAMFPALDQARLNPDCMVSFVVPSLGESWTARFIYYNNRIHGLGTRSEYRLTRIVGLLRALNAQVGDYLVFDRRPDGVVSVELEAGHGRDLADSKVLRNGWVMTIDDQE